MDTPEQQQPVAPDPEKKFHGWTPKAAHTALEHQIELKSRGQRRVNLIWECSQAVIAQAVIGVVLYMAGKIVVAAISPDAPERIVNLAITAFVFLSNISSMVIGFYFGRTNHEKTGGVAANDRRG